MGLGQSLAASRTNRQARAMTPERWQQVKRLFDSVLEKPETERTAYLAEVSAGDPELRRDVESLIAAYLDAGSRYDTPPISTDPMIGRLLGAYKILRRLGGGGMGAVYLASRADDQFRRLVAVKAIRPELLDEHTRRRFENERHTLAALEHPNIVKLLDGGATPDGAPYLVMDYVEGQPVDQYCRDHGLTIRERLQLFRSLCAAVHYAHQNLVVHRDLKPGNIIVTPQGVPKLLDFGIAKPLHPAFAAATVGFTHTVAQPMTPGYASPEQIRAQPITTASDIYALGVLLFVLLTDQHPFEGRTQSAIEMERAICENEPPKPSDAASHELARQLRGDLDAIVLTAMRREPQRRYPSAEHLAEDVRRHLDGEPVAAREESLWYHTRKFVGRHRLAVPVSIAAFALLVFLGVRDHLDRTRAERRFAELHSFANWVIQDLDPAMRKGVTPARKAVLDQGLKYLDGLAAETKGRTELQRDLVAGYLRIAAIQGDLFVDNLGDVAAAQTTAQKALAVAEELRQRDPQDRATRTALMDAHETLAGILEKAGDPAGAIEHHRKALDFAEPASLDTVKRWSRLAHTQEDAGDPAAALDSYRHYEVALNAWLTENPNDPHARRGDELLALSHERIAWLSVLAGEPPAGAEKPVRDAIATYEKAANPSPGARLNLAGAYQTLAEIQKREGKIADALQSCEKSLLASEALLAADPRNDHYRDQVTGERLLNIELLLAGKRQAEARALTIRTLADLRPLAHEGNYRYLLYYLTLLVNPSYSDPAGADDAISLARQAVEISKGRDAEALDLLARALEREEDFTEAAQQEQKALALLPPAASGKTASEIRRKISQSLTALQAKASNHQGQGK